MSLPRLSLLLLSNLILWNALPAAAQNESAIAAASKDAIPIVFPVMGPLTERLFDSFGNPRSGHLHEGQDLMAKKMTPLVAVFDGTVYFARKDQINAHNMLTLVGDNGVTARYLHVNNDTPGSDNDGKGSKEYAFAPNLRPGMHVIAGQFLGWVGNSGNAETVGSHLHFEMSRGDTLINPFASLKQAQHITEPRLALPAPSEMPGPEEVRMDGVVRTVDPGRRVVAVWTVAYQNAKGKQTIITQPAQKWLKCEEGTTLLRRDGGNETVAWKDLAPGDEVTVFVPAKVEEQSIAQKETLPLSPRRVLAEMFPRTPALVARRQPMPNNADTAPVAGDLSEAAPLEESKPVEPASLRTPPVELADRLRDHLNFYRQSRSLVPVAREGRLDHAAQSEAEALARNGGDTRGLLSETERWIRETGYRPVELYISLGFQQSTPEKAIEFLKLQRSDQVGLFHPAVTEIGVGYAEGESGGRGRRRYWVLILTAPLGNRSGGAP